jgi:hypothetical protein
VLEMWMQQTEEESRKEEKEVKRSRPLQISEKAPAGNRSPRGLFISKP